MTILSYCR